MSSLGRYIAQRVLWMVPVFFAATMIVFFMTRVVPGDPVTFRTQGKADPETVERIQDELGLNKPLPVQYVQYMEGFFTGDMGESFAYRPGSPVWDLLKERLWVSAQLNIVSLVVLYWFGIVFGCIAARNVGKWKDPGIISGLLAFQAIPTVILIPMLLWVFVVKFSVLPAAGWGGLVSLHIVIPLLALVLPSLASVARLVRISVLSTMGQDWVRTARAKGLPEHRVFVHHILRPSLLPISTQVISSFGAIFAGSFFVELLYGIPGMGRLALDAVRARDYDIIMAVFIISTVAFLLTQLVRDIVYTLIDPRIRLGEKAR